MTRDFGVWYEVKPEKEIALEKLRPLPFVSWLFFFCERPLNNSINIILLVSCSPPAADYSLVFYASFDSLLSRAGLWHLGKELIVRVTTHTKRLPYWDNGLFYPLQLIGSSVTDCLTQTWPIWVGICTSGNCQFSGTFDRWNSGMLGVSLAPGRRPNKGQRPHQGCCQISLFCK